MICTLSVERIGTTTFFLPRIGNAVAGNPLGPSQPKVEEPDWHMEPNVTHELLAQRNKNSKTVRNTYWNRILFLNIYTIHLPSIACTFFSPANLARRYGHLGASEYSNWKYLN
jgi:hypothetical protein